MIRRGVVVAHIGGIHHAEKLVLAHPYKKRRTRHEHGTTRSQIGVVAEQSCLIERSEIIRNGQARPIELQERIAIVPAAGVRIKVTVRRHYINIVGAVADYTLSRAPNSTAASIGSNIKYSGLLQSRGVVRHDPAMVVADVAH